MLHSLGVVFLLESLFFPYLNNSFPKLPEPFPEKFERWFFVHQKFYAVFVVDNEVDLVVKGHVVLFVALHDFQYYFFYFIES